jgi:hypothetical protein
VQGDCRFRTCPARAAFGGYGRWFWIGSFAVIALLILLFGFWP